MKRLPWILPEDDATPFPAPETALVEPNGLLAIGGTLAPGRLELAYRAGVFPWYSDDQPILWWSPDPRAVFPPAGLHISRSLRRRLRRGKRHATADTAFEAVIDACAAPRAYSDGTWITGAMRRAYCRLFERGIAHSVEVWEGDELAGGVYGVSLGGAFFGESMFSRRTDGSKMALAWLIAQLRRWRIDLIDCQLPNAHLESLGAITLPRATFLARLDAALEQPTRAGPWRLDADLDPLEAGAGHHDLL